MSRLHQLWRVLGITTKTTLAFSLLAVLLIAESGINYFVLRSVRQAEAEMMRSMEFSQRIFEMDGELEKARRLHRDFFINYPEIGFSEAIDKFFTPSQHVIGKVVALSEELRALIAMEPETDPLSERKADINLYLSTARRFSDTFGELVVLVNKMAAPGSGLQSSLKACKDELYGYAQLQTETLLLFVRMSEHEQNYWLSRRRSDLQSAMNTTFDLEGLFSRTDAIAPVQKLRVKELLHDYQRIARDIAEVDTGIKGKFSDFALQAKAVDPISENLKSIAGEKVASARARIDQANFISMLVMMGMAATALVGVAAVGAGMHRSITRRITGLTLVAEELRKGNLDLRVAASAGDEIDELAMTLNEMAGRVHGLIENLEHSVQERTQELTMARDELQDAVRSLDEKNRMLEILSRTDRLTSIANRRRLEEALQAEILRARRYDTPFTVIMLDIDHFKEVNDTYGHQVGDLVLIAVAEKLSRSARETDIVGRWGGEEFLLICPETSQLVGVDIAERLRRDYCEAIMPGVGHVTSSFGVATFQRNDDTGTLLQRVDEALYLAKSNGRNRVEQL